MHDIKYLWDTIVRTTENSSSDSIKSLRTVLFLRLTNKSKKNFTFYLIQILNVLHLLLFSRRVNYNTHIKNKSVFYFPFNTSANLDNLLSVLKYFSSDNVGTIITSKVVDKSLFKTHKSKLLVTEDLLLSISFLKKISKFLKAFHETRLIITSLKSEPKISDLINSHLFLYILYQLLIANLTEYITIIFLEMLNPKCIISTSEYHPFDYLLFSNAKKLGIQNFVIQHGIIGTTYYPFITSNMIVWGEYFKNDLKRLGAESAKIHVLGMPASDICFRSAKIHQFKAKSPIRKVLILSDTQAKHIWPDVYLHYYTFLKDIISNHSELSFIVRLHPSESPDFYFELLSLFPNLHISDRNKTLDQDLNDCDLSVTIWSTAGLESMIAKIPLVVLKIKDDVKELAWWPDFGGGMYIEDPDQFRNLINMIINDHHYLDNLLSKQNRFLEKCFVNQGNAAENIAKYIIEKSGFVK